MAQKCFITLVSSKLTTRLTTDIHHHGPMLQNFFVLITLLNINFNTWYSHDHSLYPNILILSLLARIRKTWKCIITTNISICFQKCKLQQ